MAKQVTKNTIAIVQTRNANGGAEPRLFATSAGKTKIPAPIVELTMFAASAGMPNARIKPASSFGADGADIAPCCAQNLPETRSAFRARKIRLRCADHARISS